MYYDINSAYIQTDGNGEGYNFEMVFKNVKDIKEHDVNFSAKFFITYHKDNNIKKWIITGYEK